MNILDRFPSELVTDPNSPVAKWAVPALKAYSDIFYELVGCKPEEDDCKSIIVKFSW